MADVDQHRRAAQAAKNKMTRARKTFDEGSMEFAAALLALNDAGIRASQLAREFDLSETHVRNTIRMEKLRQQAAG